MDRLMVVKKYTNDVGKDDTGLRSIGVVDSSIIKVQVHNNNVGMTPKSSSTTSTTTTSLASSVIHNRIVPKSNSSSSKRNKHYTVNNSNGNNNSNSNGTRFAPMEIEEALQPLRIRQPSSTSTSSSIGIAFGRGRKSLFSNNNRSRNNNNNVNKHYFNDNNNNYDHHDHYHHHDRPRIHPIDRLLIIIRLHFEYYPIICCLLISFIISIVLYFICISDYIQKPITRNRLSDDYTQMDLHYAWKASKIHHWCLWGGDDDCICDDFTEPLSREGQQEWIQAHYDNINRIDITKNYDVVFYGDEIIQSWTGRWLNMPILPQSDSVKITQVWNQTFQKDTGGKFDGLPMGIMGDTSPNLLWRLQNGEMPIELKSKVFWLLMGTNDLAMGGCSEEAVLQGILRLADEIHIHNPTSTIVIQGMLPRTKSRDGTLVTLDKIVSSSENATTKTTKIHHVSAFLHDRIVNNGNSPERAHDPDEAKKRFHLWPSIQHINMELEKFCAKHEHLVYFDANDLFLGSLGNEHYRTSTKKIIADLMPDMVHPSYDGYRIMAKVISKELTKIIYDHNEDNDIEKQKEQDDDDDEQVDADGEEGDDKYR